MTQKEYQKLVSEFKALMATGEKDQWKLAQLAYLAIDGQGRKPAEFAADTGFAVATVRRYRLTHRWSEDNRHDHGDYSFMDVWTLVGMSDERAEAVQVLADISGKAISTAARDTDSVNQVRTFLAENQELVTEALKDDDTRQGVVTAAFQAASEDMVVNERTRMKDAAKKAHQPRRSILAEDLEQLKYKCINSGIWGKANLPMISHQLDLLGDRIPDADIDEHIKNLRPAYEAMTALWEQLTAMQAANVAK